MKIVLFICVHALTPENSKKWLLSINAVKVAVWKLCKIFRPPFPTNISVYKAIVEGGKGILKIHSEVTKVAPLWKLCSKNKKIKGTYVVFTQQVYIVHMFVARLHQQVTRKKNFFFETFESKFRTNLSKNLKFWEKLNLYYSLRYLNFFLRIQ